MKKFMSATMIAGGLVLAGGQVASAYPGEDQVAPVPPVQTPTAPTPGTTLPAAGGDSLMLLQIGLITVAAGGTLVGAASLRRRRLTGI